MPGSTPKASTVAKKVGQGAQPGRPVVVPYRNLMLSQDKSRMEGYRFLWQKIKPQAIEAAEGMMQTHIPAEGRLPRGLEPQAMRTMNAAKHRREHG